MLTKLIVLCAVAFVVGLAAETSVRPSPCPAGTTYKKDCNTCTCDAKGKDKCSQITCDRPKVQPTTPGPSGSVPGDCPTLVTPAPGSNICANRSKTSVCNVDRDCTGAKKCCVDGCGVKLCRAAIYRYGV